MGHHFDRSQRSGPICQSVGKSFEEKYMSRFWPGTGDLGLVYFMNGSVDTLGSE
jgi:hypothetical protein